MQVPGPEREALEHHRGGVRRPRKAPCWAGLLRDATSAVLLRPRYLARSGSGAETRMFCTRVMTAARARIAAVRSARRTRRDSTGAVPVLRCGSATARQHGFGLWWASSESD